MAVVTAEIRFAPKNSAWFTTNAALVLADGEIVYCSDGANAGKYKIGDGTTALSGLTFYGGVSASGLTVGTTTITGGTSGRVLYNNNGVVGEYSVTGSGTTAVLSTSPNFNNYISIDNTSPFYKIDISANTQTGSEAIALTHYTASASTSPQYFMQRARGTSSSPSAVTTNNDLGYLSFRGHNGTSFTGTRAAVFATTTESWSTTANGTQLNFGVTSNTTTSFFTAASILNDGNLHMPLSTSSIYLGNITPSSTNYAIKHTASGEISVNAPTTLRIRAAGSLIATITSSSFAINNLVTSGFEIYNASYDSKIIMTRTSGSTHSFQLDAAKFYIYNNTASKERLAITNNGNVTIGELAALTTTATDGFLYVPSCAGVPTGVPTAYTGKIPIVVDSTNNKMYIYSGGAWVALN